MSEVAEMEKTRAGRSIGPYEVPSRPSVMRVRHRTEPEMLAEKAGDGQDMAGFPDRYADIIDYIVRITREIWIDGAVGLIYDTYDPNCVVYTTGDIGRGVETVVQSTISSMASFPDLDNHFLNIAWSGDAAAGFYTSHLGFGSGVNIRESSYGPATGKTATIRFCADCITLDGRIHTEWLARDNGALIRQIGFDLHETARHLSRSAPREVYTHPAPSRLDGQSPPKELENPPRTIEEHFLHLFHDVWNRRRFDLLVKHYVPNVRVHTAGGRFATGIPALRALHLSLLASMPDATLTVGNICWSDETDGVIVAIRWELSGTARSGGWFGQVPDDAPIFVLGMTHCRVDDDCRVVEEWTVFDEVAALAQVYRAAS